MQRIIITGNLGRDPEMRATQDGTPICNFSVGVRQGWGDRASSNWFRCSVFGTRAKTISEHLAKGQKVTVIGELTIGEYNGKPRYDVRVDDLDWQPSGDRQQRSDDRGGGGGGFGGAGARGGFADDLDDDVPFMSSCFIAGLRAS